MHQLLDLRDGDPLPPASPASHELDIHNPEVTVFLIGAYAKYNWPYVWVSWVVNLALSGGSDKVGTWELEK